MEQYTSGKEISIYDRLSLLVHQGTIEICSPYPKFVLTGVTKYKKGFAGDRNSKNTRVHCIILL